jgi:hypothetical protein
VLPSDQRIVRQHRFSNLLVCHLLDHQVALERGLTGMVQATDLM